MNVESFPRSKDHAINTLECLQLMHSDVMVPLQTKSEAIPKWVVTFIDDYSRYTRLLY